MRDLLYLTHRIPYPPNKGDKIRAYHVLRYLARYYRVHLGSFVDDAQDLAHAATLAQWCASSHLVRLHPWRQRLLSAQALLCQQALSVAYYRHRSMQQWVTQTLASYRISQALAFSGPMAQYLPAHTLRGPLERVLDLVDVDSEKWQQYAQQHHWPLSYIYAREARLLRRFESDMASRLDRVLLVSPAEASLFRHYAPEAAHKISYFSNGVDCRYFCPDPALPNPYSGMPVLVFTGAMDYPPNIEGAIWLVRQVMPRLSERYPTLQLHLVGARPAHAVRTLAQQPGVFVSGTVADIRPYLQHATLALAPLKIARGIQNKVLEAMAMARTVVATPQAMEGIHAQAGRDVIVASTAEAFADSISAQLDGGPALGAAARRQVLACYQWEENLQRLGSVLGLPRLVSAQSLAAP